MTLTWYGHDSFLINEGVHIYLDPWQLPDNLPPADLILITHEHGDHLSFTDIAKIIRPDTTLFAPTQAASTLTNYPHLRIVKPGQTLDWQELKITTVPAYNINKFRSPGVPFHPKEPASIGYLITLAGRTVYHPGDTDHIPEMANLTGQVDLMLVPVSGTYVMTADEATEAVTEIKPRRAIPMHYGSIIGSRADAEQFAKQVTVPVTIMQPNQSINPFA